MIVVDGGVQVALVHEVFHSLAHLRLGEPPVELLRDDVNLHALVASPVGTLEDRLGLIHAATARGVDRGGGRGGRRGVRGPRGGGGVAGSGGGRLGIRPRRVVRVAVDGFEEVVGDLVVVLDGPDAERDDGGVAAELLDVAVDARVLADGHRVLLGRRVGVVRVDPLLHDDGAGAVVECVHLVGGGVGGLDDLAEEGDVVDLLAVDAKALVLYVSGGAARLAENRQCLCSLQLGSKTQLCGFEIAGWI